MAAKKTDGVIANPRGITQGTPIVSQVASSRIVTEAVNGAQRKVQHVRTVLFFEGDKVNTDDLSNWDHHVERGFVTEG